MRYAIGEIVLVVIGILIALNINNRNERNKNELTTIAILKTIQENLISDVVRSEDILDSYLIIKLRNEKIFDFIDPLSEKDYKEGKVHKSGTTVDYFILKDEGYQNLSKLSNVSNKFAFIVDMLTNMYSKNIPLLELYNERVRTTVTKHLDFLSLQNWEVYQMKNGMPSQEELDYYLFDDRYKSYLLKWTKDRGNVVWISQQHRLEAIEIYHKIDSILNIEKTAFPEHILGRIDSNSVKKYLGFYEIDGYTKGYEELYINNDHLVSDWLIEGVRNIKKFPTTRYRKINDSIFVAIESNSIGFLNFVENENGKIHIDFIDDDNQWVKFE